MMKRREGYALIEVVMALFLISLLATMMLMVYKQTISGYNDKRIERKSYILVNNIHQEFLSNPKAYYTNQDTGLIETHAGIIYYDEHLRICTKFDKFYYRVFYSVDVDNDLKQASLFLATVEAKGRDVITDLRLGKMRITP